MSPPVHHEYCNLVSYNTPYAAPCCHGCLMASHNREGVNPMGTQLLSVALLAVTVNTVAFIAPVYSYLIFGSFLFVVGGCTGPARGPCECIHISRNGKPVMMINLLHILLYRSHTKSQHPFLSFFYFNCIFFGYIWLPGGYRGGVYLLPGVDNGY